MSEKRINRAEEILLVIRSGKSDEEILALLEDFHSNDIARAFEEMTEEERGRLYGVLDTEALSDVFTYFDEPSEFVEEISPETAADILETMDVDDAVEMLEQLDGEKYEELIELVDDETRTEIEKISSYSDDEFGSVMTTNFIVIKKDLTIKGAMRELIAQSAENDNISTIYVVDEKERLYGAIELKSLIIARQDSALEDIIVTSYPFVYDHDSISESIEDLRSYSEDSVPVLSVEDDRVVGVITSQDIVDMIDSEMSEDYARLAGLSTEDDMDESLFASVKKRIPWLIVLLFLGLGVSAVVGVFESIVKELAVIVCFQSLILGMAGNVGTQSLAVTIRVLSSDRNEDRIGLRLLFKELRVAFVNGAVLGAFSVVFIGLYLYLLKSQSLSFAFSASACVGLSLCIAMFVAGIMGTVVPLVFDKLKIDPAVASGPLITTVNDLSAVVTYYGLVWFLLIRL